MTDLEILKDSIQSLGAIQVPVAFNETIGTPIFRVCQNLSILCTAVEKAAKEKDEPVESQEEVKE